MTDIERMKELIAILNEAARVYYSGTDEIMSNFEYDKLYDELSALEEKTGMVLSGSPTVRVGYEVLSELPKERHEHPVLSLAKTKEVDELVSWLGDKEGVLSWKLDGLTVVMTYEDGHLVKALTRGNGEIGEIITNNARTFVNIPVTIPYKDKVVIRGEAIIRYDDFERINEQIEDPDERYKNPRNLCSGTVRQLNNQITAERNVYYIAYDVMESDIIFPYKHEEIDWLNAQGFDVVGHDIVDANNISDVIKEYSERIKTNEVPSDGLVLSYDDKAYGESLGRTAKFPRHSIAFKWADETAETTLVEVEWSASRTGLINPIAVFEPVWLEGTSVSRASVHNVSIVKELELGIGDKLLVYKANMIIPQIAENLTKSGDLVIPDTCPVCGSKTEIYNDNGTETLNCPNPECTAKKIKSFTHFVSRQAMNIDGLSEATIEKFIAEKIITDLVDIFRLERHKEEIVSMEGFGEKSYNNLIDACEKAKNVNLANFLFSLGISGIGFANARVICSAFDYDIDSIMSADEEELATIDGIGDVLARGFVDFMTDDNNICMIRELLNEVHIEKPAGPADSADAGKLKGMTFVITGALENYTNRDELKSVIESMGGKVAGSVSKNTAFLINNDIMSSSSKNKKAKELGVSIITENDFIERFIN